MLLPFSRDCVTSDRPVGAESSQSIAIGGCFPEFLVLKSLSFKILNQVD